MVEPNRIRYKYQKVSHLRVIKLKTQIYACVTLITRELGHRASFKHGFLKTTKRYSSRIYGGDAYEGL